MRLQLQRYQQLHHPLQVLADVLAVEVHFGEPDLEDPLNELVRVVLGKRLQELNDIRLDQVYVALYVLVEVLLLLLAQLLHHLSYQLLIVARICMHSTTRKTIVTRQKDRKVIPAV